MVTLDDKPSLPDHTASLGLKFCLKREQKPIKNLHTGKTRNLHAWPTMTSNTEMLGNIPRDMAVVHASLSCSETKAGSSV